MHPIELPVSVGAPLAKWRRVYSTLTVSELLEKIRRRMASRVLLWYRRALELAFKTRNTVTRNATVRGSVGDIEFRIVPEGVIAFETWSGLRSKRTELEFFLRMLQPGMTLFDIGANIGLYSLAAGRKLRGQPSSIYAIEPHASTYAILKQNLSQNELAEVRAIRALLSDRTRCAAPSAGTATRGAQNSLEDPSHASAEAARQELLQTITLDDLVAGQNIARVDLMKVAAEGAEMQVLRGAEKLLERADAPLILYESYSQSTAGFQYHPVELMWHLEALEYELFVLDAASCRARQRTPGECYDAVVVAAKRSHPHYNEIFQGGEKA